jgi:hypothetical protein
MIVSPGLAGTVVVPANVPFLAARLKSCRVATAWLLGHAKNAGPKRSDCRAKGRASPQRILHHHGGGPRTNVRHNEIDLSRTDGLRVVHRHLTASRLIY